MRPTQAGSTNHTNRIHTSSAVSRCVSSPTASATCSLRAGRLADPRHQCSRTSAFHSHLGFRDAVLCAETCQQPGEQLPLHRRPHAPLRRRHALLPAAALPLLRPRVGAAGRGDARLAHRIPGRGLRRTGHAARRRRRAVYGAARRAGHVRQLAVPARGHGASGIGPKVADGHHRRRAGAAPPDGADGVEAGHARVYVELRAHGGEPDLLQRLHRRRRGPPPGHRRDADAARQGQDRRRRGQRAAAGPEGGAVHCRIPAAGRLLEQLG